MTSMAVHDHPYLFSMSCHIISRMSSLSICMSFVVVVISFKQILCSKLSLRVLLCPLFRLCDRSIRVSLPVLCDVVGERIVRIRCAEERLDREQDRADLECW